MNNNIHDIDGDGQTANKKLFLPFTIRYALFMGLSFVTDVKRESNIFFTGF